MKKYTFLLIVLALSALLEPAMAQRRFKRNIPIWYRSRFYSTVGGGIGTANYFGDLVPTTSFTSTELKFTRSSLNVFYAHKYTPLLTVRGSLAWHRLKGDDFESANPNDREDYGRYVRNLHFRNDVIELTGVAMFDLIQHNNPFFRRPTWTPYAFIGLGFIYSNPKARTPSNDGSGDWVSLRPLQTEGNSYSPIQIVIPAGVGVRYKLNQRIDLGFEIGYRYAFTDYLDDVKGRYADPVSLKSNLARTMAMRTAEEYAADAGQSREQSIRNIQQNFRGCTNCDDPNVPYSDVAIQAKEGSLRGHGKGNDWYLVTNFHISYILVDVIQRARFR